MTIIQDITMANDGINAEHDEAHVLAERARRHLWLHFSRMGRYDQDHEIPVIVRGEGSWVYDSRGKRYFDGISSLFTSQLGHGRKDLAAVAAQQAGELAYFPLWTYAHPNAINLAAELAQLAPGDLNRVFFTSGGGRIRRECLEVGSRLSPHQRRSVQVQGHYPKHCLPRHHHGGPRTHVRT